MGSRDLDEWIAIYGASLRNLSSECTISPRKIGPHKGWEPRMDVFDLEDALLIQVELAGVKSGQVGLAFNPDLNTLTVRGERLPLVTEGDRRCVPLHLEIEYGEFTREIRLPESMLDIANTSTRLLGGMLTVLVPKITGPTVTIEHTVRFRRD